MFHVHIVIFNSPIDTANYLLIHTDKGKVENNILPKIIAKKKKTAQFLPQKNCWYFITDSCFSDSQLHVSYISINIFEYLNQPCHGPLVLNTFILKYQNNITNTEISFPTFPFCTWLKWLKIFLSQTCPQFIDYMLDTTPSFLTA